MLITAHLRRLRMSPRKVRVVADVVRGLDVAEAQAQLMHASWSAALPLRKLIASATANAEHNAQLDRSNLFVKSIVVDQGPTLKRFRARAFGRAAPIRRRTSHVTVVLDERVPTQPKERPSTPAPVLPAPMILDDRPRAAPGQVESDEATANDTKGTRANKGVAPPKETGGTSERPGKRGGGGLIRKFLNRRSGER